MRLCNSARSRAPIAPHYRSKANTESFTPRDRLSPDRAAKSRISFSEMQFETYMYQQVYTDCEASHVTIEISEILRRICTKNNRSNNRSQVQGLEKNTSVIFFCLSFNSFRLTRSVLTKKGQKALL